MDVDGGEQSLIQLDVKHPGDLARVLCAQQIELVKVIRCNLQSLWNGICKPLGPHLLRTAQVLHQPSGRIQKLVRLPGFTAAELTAFHDPIGSPTEI